MSFQIEFRRLPSVYVVTGGAFARIRTLRKLAVVRILVTVGALREYKVFLEISVCVTRTAGNLLMLALQRILSF